MKRVLITGKNSYLGTHVKERLERTPDRYQVEELDLKDGCWREKDFSGYDCIYHVAGLAHSTPKDSEKDLYYQVNTELAYQVAKKACEQGVSQFIFMSSIIIYGKGSMGTCRIITKETPVHPDNFYGNSKWQAEKKLNTLKRDGFRLVILRPPMIYGKGSKGNYTMLSSFAQKTPIFPNLENQRSICYVENLAAFVQCAIDHNLEGVYFPQNKEYVSTKELVSQIASVHHRKVIFVGLFNPLLRALKGFPMVYKAFGNLVIDPSLSTYDFDYQEVDLKTSIIATESKG